MHAWIGWRPISCQDQYTGTSSSCGRTAFGMKGRWYLTDYNLTPFVERGPLDHELAPPALHLERLDELRERLGTANSVNAGAGLEFGYRAFRASFEYVVRVHVLHVGRPWTTTRRRPTADLNKALVRQPARQSKRLPSPGGLCVLGGSPSLSSWRRGRWRRRPRAPPTLRPGSSTIAARPAPTRARSSRAGACATSGPPARAGRRPSARHERRRREGGEVPRRTDRRRDPQAYPADLRGHRSAGRRLRSGRCRRSRAVRRTRSRPQPEPPPPPPKPASPTQVEELVRRSNDNVDFFELVDDMIDEIARRLALEDPNLLLADGHPPGPRVRQPAPRVRAHAGGAPHRATAQRDLAQDERLRRVHGAALARRQRQLDPDAGRVEPGRPAPPGREDRHQDLHGRRLHVQPRPERDLDGGDRASAPPTARSSGATPTAPTGR